MTAVHILIGMFIGCPLGWALCAMMRNADKGEPVEPSESTTNWWERSE